MLIPTTGTAKQTNRKEKHTVSKLLRRLTQSGDNVRLERAQIVTEKVANVFNSKHLALKARRDEIKAQINQLNDFGPDTSDSLRPASRDFSETGYVLKLTGLHRELRELNDEMADLRAAYNDCFGDEASVPPAPATTTTAEVQ